MEIKNIIEKNCIFNRIVKFNFHWYANHHEMNSRYENTMEKIYKKIDSNNYQDDINAFLSFITTLLQKTLIEESALYCVYEWGDLKHEICNDFHYYQDRQLIFLVEEFTNQFVKNNSYGECVRFFTFLTQAILKDIKHIDYKNTYNPQSTFSAFLPRIANGYEDISSQYTQYISPIYRYCQLTLPEKAVEDPCYFLPSYLHILFSKITPRNNIEVNNVTLRLVIHSILNDFYNQLHYNFGIEAESLYNTIFNNIYEFKKREYEYLYKNADYETIQELDSRVFVSYMQEAHSFSEYSWDETFLRQYDDAICKLPTNVINFCKNYRKTLKKGVAMAFEENSVNSISATIRSIRSDIFMCKLLDMNIENYIKLLAESYEFAKKNIDEVNVQSILRFGYVVHYLFGKEKDVADNDWLNFAKNILKKLYEENETIKSSCDNLIAYLDEYYNITIGTSDDVYTKMEYSIFEQNINLLIKDWEKEIAEYKQSDILKCLKEAYYNKNISILKSKIDVVEYILIQQLEVFAYLVSNIVKSGWIESEEVKEELRQVRLKLRQEELEEGSRLLEGFVCYKFGPDTPAVRSSQMIGLKLYRKTYKISYHENDFNASVLENWRDIYYDFFGSVNSKQRKVYFGNYKIKELCNDTYEEKQQDEMDNVNYRDIEVELTEDDLKCLEAYLEVVTELSNGNIDIDDFEYKTPNYLDFIPGTHYKQILDKLIIKIQNSNEISDDVKSISKKAITALRKSI